MPPRYAGLDGLRQAHPIDVALSLFMSVFAGASLNEPLRPGRSLDACMAALCGESVRAPSAAAWLGLTMSSNPRLQPYVMEAVLIWQQTRVAALRTWGGQTASTTAVLLPRGARLLADIDPAHTLRGWLEAPGG